jgi:hypothetical protein
MKAYKKAIFLSTIFLMASGCVQQHNNLCNAKKSCHTCKYDICDIISQPESISIIETQQSHSIDNKAYNKNTMLDGFPFVSYKPVIDFSGKFPPEFYSSIKLRWNAAPIEKANFWDLRWNPYLYDVIYAKPFWIGDFKLKSNDLIEDMSRSYNISSKEIGILKNWVKQGGTLWIESALYISSYDVSLNKLNTRKIVRIANKLRRTRLFGRKLNVFILKSRRIDRFHTKPLRRCINVKKYQSSLPKALVNVDRLLLNQYDYVGIYFTLNGKPIVRDGVLTYASYIEYGKGMIVTTVPFDFINVHYDGEMYRWNMLNWIIDNRIRTK